MPNVNDSLQSYEKKEEKLRRVKEEKNKRIQKPLN